MDTRDTDEQRAAIADSHALCHTQVEDYCIPDDDDVELVEF